MKKNHIHLKAPKGYIYNELGSVINIPYAVAQMKKADPSLFLKVTKGKDMEQQATVQSVFCEFSDSYEERHGGAEFAVNKIKQDD